MPIKVTCNNCGGVLHAPDDSAGKKGRCPTCGTVLTINSDMPNPTGASVFGAPMGGTDNSDKANRPLPFPPVGGPWTGTPPVFGKENATQPGPKPAAFPPASNEPRSSYDIAGMPESEPIRPVPGTPPNTHGSRVPPDPRKYSEPMAKPGRPATAKKTESDDTRWNRVRKGLGWVQFAGLFAFLAVVGATLIPILAQFGVNLPDKLPGYLGMDTVSSTTEIGVGAVMVPVVLALFCLLIGRMGVSAAPSSSYARGPALASSLATLVAVGGAIALLAITGLGVKDGFVPKFQASPIVGANLQTKAHDFTQSNLLPTDGIAGVIQRFGLAAFLAFGLVAEIWFFAALGRIAAYLKNATASARINCVLILKGTLLAFAVLACVATQIYGDWITANIWSKWNGLDAKTQAIAVPGIVLFVGFAIFLIHTRMVGGVKRAIRDHVDPASI